MTTTMTPVMPDADLWDGEMRGVVVAGARVLLVRVGGEAHAYADRCAHLGVALSEGELSGTTITCRAHHYTYDACTGCGVNPPTTRLARYPLAVVDGTICVEIGALEPGSSPGGDEPPSGARAPK